MGPGGEVVGVDGGVGERVGALFKLCEGLSGNGGLVSSCGVVFREVEQPAMGVRGQVWIDTGIRGDGSH